MKAGATLFVGNLPFTASLAEVARCLVAALGDLAAPADGFLIAADHDKTLPKGRLFVRTPFLDDDRLRDATARITSAKLEGRTLRCDIAKALQPEARFQDGHLTLARLSPAAPEPAGPALASPARNRPTRAQAAPKERKGNDPDVRRMPLQESPYPIVDIGTNLLGVEQLQRARELNVQPLILTGTDLAGSRKRADLVRRHPGTLYSTAGIHPHQAKTFSPAVLEELRQLAQMPGVVAVGETGLDYNRNFSSPAQQRASFRAHVQLAAELDLPLFCHEREAHADFVAVLDEFPRLPPVIVHCFTGERPELHDYVQRGYYIGVTGYLGMQRRGAALREFLAAEVPLERLMIETDAPYMAPDAARPHIGRNNAPFTLPLVLDVVALLYGMDRADTARRLTQTTVEVFRLQAVHQS